MINVQRFLKPRRHNSHYNNRKVEHGINKGSSPNKQIPKVAVVVEKACLAVRIVVTSIATIQSDPRLISRTGEENDSSTS